MSNKETTLKEKFKLALTSTAKVISDDFELNSKSTDKKKQKEYAQHWIKKGLHTYHDLLIKENPGEYSFGR